MKLQAQLIRLHHLDGSTRIKMLVEIGASAAGCAIEVDANNRKRAYRLLLQECRHYIKNPVIRAPRRYSVKDVYVLPRSEWQ